MNRRSNLIRGSIVEGDINCEFYCLDHPASIASNTADSWSRWTTPSTRTRPADPWNLCQDPPQAVNLHTTISPLR